MKLTQLKYFQTVCKYNNITRAASELHISQPSLSGAIRELEEEFGVSLFHRLSKGLALTEEGEFLLEEATKLLEQSDNLILRMHELSESHQTVKLGVPPMLASLIFPRLLQAFHANFPKARLQMIENGTLTNKNMVLDGTLDAAIISSDSPVQPSFGHCDLCSLKISYYVSARHPLAGRTSIDLATAAAMPLALLAEDSFLTSYMAKQFKTQNLSPNIIVNTNQLAAIRQLIEGDIAASFLFDGILGTDQGITKIPVDGLSTIYARLIWNAGRHLSPGTQNLIRLAKAGF